MKISTIEIENYKSIKNNETLYLSDGVTTIIGKNESGKSNVLDLIGHINLNLPTNIEHFKKPNTKCVNKNTLITFKFELNDKQKSCLNVESETSIIRFDTAEPTFQASIVEGFQKEYFNKDNYTSRIQRLYEIVEKYISSNNQAIKSKLQMYISLVEKLNTIHGVNWKNNILETEKRSNLINDEKVKEEFKSILTYISEYIEILYYEFPTIVYYKEQELKSEYKFVRDDFKDLKTKHGKPLIDFLKAVRFDEEKFSDLIFSTSDDVKRDLKDELEENLDKYINNKFNEFYKQDKVKLTVDINSNRISFFVKSSKANINLSERSNGLKWYMNLFISITANDDNNSKKMLLIIDEPGVYLHVDAQRELRKLLYDLSKKHQILYSTHSPFMIDDQRITDIRVTQKEDSGITNIINNIFSDDIAETSKLETLSPLLNSLGISHPYMFGISNLKINVITEGIVDAIYLRALARLLGEERFVFIPSVGARNIHLIVRILWGWNLKCIALFDNDNEGRSAERNLKKDMEDVQCHLLSSDNQSGDIEIENLISNSDLERMEINKDKLISEKRYSAIKITEFMHKNFSTVSDETKENFIMLFSALGSKFE
ncbi:hypothetical protein E4T89_04325 [Jeotgalicoccus nanhaiensis]|uniref:AAA family ATPase n=1 Tax=Jeotgalicoccus nanhaiensis TaxID=568603 RepID=A0ABR9XXI4_9STAP|nr:AAA family ATPase [Jeotgalicoccus nanhaiensis]MBF0753491.1 AAA family ATPase [Jeotgalicoccus nanhaiensis]TFU62647.1 hypothetical protein E4T89_04325 [Jeotgalicoccus nanhaiensis]